MEGLQFFELPLLHSVLKYPREHQVTDRENPKARQEEGIQKRNCHVPAQVASPKQQTNEDVGRQQVPGDRQSS